MSFHQEEEQLAQKAQQEAAQSIKKQVRLVAGPGTGKSRTIEQRVAWLLQNGVAPDRIAVVSFTNYSVRDLRERIKLYCEAVGIAGADKLPISTLHSLALKLLKKTGNLKDYPVEPMVLSSAEIEDWIYDPEFKEAADLKGGKRCEEVRRLYEAFWSTGQKAPETYLPADPPITEAEEHCFISFHYPTSQVYSCVLPGEIVQKCVELSEHNFINPQAELGLEHLIVDEYQDLNAVDLKLIDIFAAQGVDLFVAGDDDQSVYSFRHAMPRGIQIFPDKYPNSDMHVLNHCFRCTTNVLTAAQKLITKNSPQSRIPKNPVSLFANSVPAVPGHAHLWSFTTDRHEARALAISCESLIQQGMPPDKIYILLANAKNSHQLWPLIRDEMLKRGLPFSPPKEESFAGSKAGMLAQALCRIVYGRDNDGEPQDAVAHRLLVGAKEGVGVKTCNYLRKVVQETANSTYFDLFYQALPVTITNSRAKAALNHARGICAELGDWAKADTVQLHAEQIASILEKTVNADAAQAWRTFADILPDGLNLAELIPYIGAETDEERNRVIADMCQRTNVPVPDPDTLPKKIRVMTMHGAKGLTASVVFIPGLESGVLPNTRALKKPALKLEAARLLYVSITRARAACLLSFAESRMTHGRQEFQRPSPFLMDTGLTKQARISGLSCGEAAAILATTTKL